MTLKAGRGQSEVILVLQLWIHETDGVHDLVVQLVLKLEMLKIITHHLAPICCSHGWAGVTLGYCGISTDCSVTRHIRPRTEQIWCLSRVTGKVE